MKNIIKTKVAEMMKELYKPFIGLTVDMKVVIDIAQLTYDFRKELRIFANELGEPSGDFDLDKALDEFDEAMDELRACSKSQ